MFANSRTIVHAGDDLQHTCATPDVCKTPSPGGPVPVPYPNVAASRDLAKGTKRVKIANASVAIEGSHLKTSVGDEPGTAGGGLISAKTKGKLTWGNASANVRFEGKGVVRFGDVTQHNGNSFNAAFVALGGTGLAYADDFVGPCPICTQGPERHRILETTDTVGKAKRLLDELRRGFEAAADDEQRERYAYFNDGRPWGGYMIGVMACKCEPARYFCANSGPEFAGVRDAAQAVGMTYIGGTGIVSVNEFVRANASNLSRELKITRVNDARQVLRPLSRLPRYSGFGSCAAAKLLARCSHAPATMTEMFFAPPGSTWSARYDVLTTSERSARPSKRKFKGQPDWAQQVLANRKAKVRKIDFGTERSVASCHTCQQSLYLTMCPERVCPGG